jgi:hypothetical protein
LEYVQQHRDRRATRLSNQPHFYDDDCDVAEKAYRGKGRCMMNGHRAREIPAAPLNLTSDAGEGLKVE